MHLTLIKNTDESKIVLYKIARVVYAETDASSLASVEALTSMISNLCVASKRQLEDIVSDKNIFESLNKTSSRYKNLFIDASHHRFQMCLRVVSRMLSGQLADACYGATRFHHTDVLPDWATSLGYVAEVDNLLFYL